MKMPICLIVPLSLLMLTGCSKSADPVTAPISVPPDVTAPSGIIKEFFVRDTLIAFNDKSVVKWNITGTNSKTIVTINGIKVGVYGMFETAPLKQATNYVLEVNSGVKKTITAQVADSVTSLMWHDGKRLKQIKAEVYVYVMGEGPKWVDITNDRIINERTSFFLNGDSKIEQLSPAYEKPKASGKFVVNLGQLTFTWQGNIYTFVCINEQKFIITYYAKDSLGNNLQNRSTYILE